jgi:limonene-1,2-epoxide hydrolase
VTPEEVVRAVLHAWSRLDVDELATYFTADAVWDNVPIGVVSGQDEIREAIAEYVSRATSADIEILNLAVIGSTVLTERVDHFRWDGHLVNSRVMGAFEIAGEKIASWRDYFDMSDGGH